LKKDEDKIKIEQIKFDLLIADLKKNAGFLHIFVAHPTRDKYQI